MRKTLLAVGTGIFAVLLVANMACSSSDDVTGSTGQLNVNLHDQAAPGIAEAHVTLSALELRDANSGEWVVVDGNLLPVTVDLLLLVGGNEAQILADLVPAGDYDGMRITISEVLVVLDDQTQIQVPPPGAPVQVVGFPLMTIDEGGVVTVTLDFPVAPSFQVVAGPDVTFTPQITVDP
jgi:hypothetical protein